MSSSTPGVLVTITLRFFASATSMLLKPTAILLTTFTVGQASKKAASIFSVRQASTPAQPRARAHNTSAVKMSSSSLWSTTNCCESSATISGKTCRVIRILGFICNEEITDGAHRARRVKRRNKRPLQPGELFRRQSRPELPYLYKTLGSHKPMPGNMYSRNRAKTCITMNGIIPRKIWFSVTCGGDTPLR